MENQLSPRGTDLKQIQAMEGLFKFGVNSGLISESFAGEIIEDVKNKSDYPENTDDLCDMHEARHLTGVSAVTVYNWVKEGKLKKFKVGSRTRFLRSEVKALIHLSDGTEDIPQFIGKRGQYHNSDREELTRA